MALTKATKAALLSALIFPGVGLLWLKHYKRAAIFITPTVLALWYLISTLYKSIAPVYTQMLRDAQDGTLTIDPTNLSELYLKLHQEIYQSIAMHQDQLAVAKMILIAAWLCSIISSYFVGKKYDIASTNEISTFKP